MATADFNTEPRRRGGGAIWFWMLLLLILFAGGAFSVVAYQHEPGLTVFEAIGVGFAAFGAVVIGLFAAAIGVVVGLIGALVGVVAAGGALALTAFLIGSPIIAIILFVLLMRRSKQNNVNECPDPSAHELIE